MCCFPFCPFSGVISGLVIADRLGRVNQNGKIVLIKDHQSQNQTCRDGLNGRKLKKLKIVFSDLVLDP